MAHAAHAAKELGKGQVREFHYKTRVLQMRLLISIGFHGGGLGLWALAGWGFSGFDAVLGAVVTSILASRRFSISARSCFRAR